MTRVVLRSAPTAALLALVVVTTGSIAYLEPPLHDVWQYRKLHDEHRFADYLVYMYRELDARIGNAILYWICEDGPAHLLWTPAAVVAYVVGGFALAFGRWPRPADPRDAWRLLVLVALFWIATPSPGVMMFYRPFAAMYLHAFAILVLVLLPYRFALGRRPASSSAATRAIAMGLAGLVGGFTNEHTVPTAIVLVATCVWYVRRRDGRAPPWMFAGLVGLTLGFLLLFFAPAQDHRYEGLAAQATILERIAARGLVGNLAYLGLLVRHAAWMWLAIAASAALWAWRRPPLGPVRDRAIAIALLALAAVAIVVTMLASPKQGFRLIFASSSLLVLAGLLALDVLAPRRLAAVVAAAIVIGHAAVAVDIYRTLHVEATARYATLAAAPAGSWPSVPAFTRWRHDRWVYGDDLADRPLRRRLVRKYWHVAGIGWETPVK